MKATVFSPADPTDRQTPLGLQPEDMNLSSRQTFVAILVVGLLGTGLLVRFLNQAGYFTIGVAVWIVGYGATILVLWYGWIRPLDLSGPTDRATASADGDGDAGDRD
jgi:hypothetical protein